MSDNRKYYYLKLKENYFDDDSIVLLESMQDGVLYSNILLKLYLKSLKHGGRLQLDEDIPYTAQMIATITRQQIGTVERALQIFLKLGLVEVLDSGTFYMSNIELLIGQSSTEAERKRAARLQNKALSAPRTNGGHLSDIRPPEIEIELEKEIEIKREIEKGHPAPAYGRYQNVFLTDEELGRLGIDFVSIRESFDTSSPMGRAMMYIASVFSQLERETIAERIRDNMHELAKTGRWLGGTTPTGYASESVKSITVDGKTKKACKLKLLPDEAEIIYKIFDLYEQYDSLTMTETELLRQGIKTKTGRSFTRFSIKSILQNPVYLIADKDAYQYFVDNEAELFSPESDFDGVRGVLAYNRSDQEKGRATVYNPINEWIVSVGEHPGIISSNRWIRVQESLERNKSKSYHKSRGNEALLTGLLWCSCGSRMYPKVTGRKTADGQVVFPYMCKLKERSRRELCNVRNANGNLLDAAICEQVKHLADHSSDFMKQLEKAKSAHAGNHSEFETKLSTLRKEQAETQRKINALIDSLADFSDSTAAVHLKKRIEELNGQDATLSSRIRELESLTDNGVLGGIEFDVMRQLLTVFHDNIDDMTVTQKRAAIRTVVRKVVWDGKVAHVVLFGSPEDEIDWTTFPVDPEDDEGGGSGPETDGSDSPSGVRWGEDSILNASTGIGRKPRLAGGVKGIHGLHQPNGSN